MSKKDVQYRSIKPGNVLISRNPRNRDNHSYNLVMGIPVPGFTTKVKLPFRKHVMGAEYGKVIHPKGQLIFKTDLSTLNRKILDREPTGIFGFINPLIWEDKEFGSVGEEYDERIIYSENPEFVGKILEAAKNTVLIKDPFLRNCRVYSYYTEDRPYPKDVSPIKNLLNSEEKCSEVLGQIEKLLGK
mgnify:CR=1 FL=1|jgi:hypothetical protein|tara:strand:- start:2029 stop:2589 length:561 start_codon:yes stop_codon:yes gene_type:complete